MRKFWGFYDNGTYHVGCNGATIYVYDQENRKLGKYRDISYAYCGAFQPGTNIFVAKSTADALAVYDLDSLKLLKKSVLPESKSRTRVLHICQMEIIFMILKSRICQQIPN